MLLLLNSDYGAVKKTLKLNRLLTNIFTHVVLKLCRNKNLRY